MRKGQYDLGRKAVYYMVVIIVIGLVFAYFNGALASYQSAGLIHINDMENLVIGNYVISCLSNEENGRKHFGEIDNERFKKEVIKECMKEFEIPVRKLDIFVHGDDKRIVFEPEKKPELSIRDYLRKKEEITYKRFVIFEGEIKMLEVKHE